MADLPTDPQQDALFREVEDDLRHEQIAKLWKQYGGYVIACAVLIVAIVAGYQGWMAWQSRERAKEAMAYEKAEGQLLAKKTEDGLATLQALSGDASTGYGALARLRAAAEMVEEGKTAEAVAAYRQLVNDTKADPALRDLSRVLLVLHSLDLPEADLNALQADLAPVLNPANAYQTAAREVQALLALKRGDVEAAKDDLLALAKGAEVPQGIKARARDILAGLGVPESEIDPKTDAAPTAQPQ